MASLFTKYTFRLCSNGTSRLHLYKPTFLMSDISKVLTENYSNCAFNKHTSLRDNTLIEKLNIKHTAPNLLYSTQKVDAVSEDSTEKLRVDAEKPKELSRTDKLKLAVKEYGSTVIVFHVSISLISLGTCYMLVSSGVDVASILNSIGISEESTNKLATTSGTFVAAYAIHKVFAPVRISITLGATPFIVRYLRLKGWIKKP